MKKFHLNITSKDSELFDGEVDMVIVPGSEGELGILADHTPFISPVKEGRVRIKRQGYPEQTFDTKSGFVEVSEQGVTILVK